MSRDEFKYIIGIGSVIMLGCLAVLFINSLGHAETKVTQLEQQVADGDVAIVEDATDAPASNSNTVTNTVGDVDEDLLDTETSKDSFEFLREFYNRDWNKIYYALCEYCDEHNTAYNNLVCISTELQFTDRYTPYVIIRDGDTRLLALLETEEGIADVSITPID